ncbi:MAG: efflux RND transporter periplasmic adaptor subunit [Bacteroidaceae bacterium]|nr:efflux RND transporter periplasmic adaptor subunit [Bacteroidaceae bacterium]
MKKITGTAIVVVIVAGAAYLLYANKANIRQQAQEVADAGSDVMVRTMKVQSENYSHDFTSNGVTAALTELNFVSDVQGRVVRIAVEKGSVVRKGDVLLEIDKELLQADYNANKAAYDALKKDEQRFARSNEAGGVTSQQLDNIRTQLAAAESRLTVSAKRLADATVKAPLSGKVNMRYVEPGSLIAPNTPLFDIVDDSRLKLTCNVPESRVRMLTKGQKVTVVGGTPEREYSGEISFIGIKTDRGLNYPVEIVLDRDENLQIGMYMKVMFTQTAQTGSILVPRKAIVGSAKAANVYLVRDGKAVMRQVQLGDMVGDRVEILSGLDENDEIIVAGLMNVADGTAVAQAE